MYTLSVGSPLSSLGHADQLPPPPQVCEERRRSRRSLHRIHKMGRHGRATAPPLDGYDDESSIVRANIEEQFLNHGLHDSTNKLPLPGSTSSMDEVGQASTLRAPTQV